MRQAEFEQRYRQEGDPGATASAVRAGEVRRHADGLRRRVRSARRWSWAARSACSARGWPAVRALTTIDFSATAVDAARRSSPAVPQAPRCVGEIPDDIPDGRYDLVVASEILYYLDAGALSETLAARANADPRRPAGRGALATAGPTARTRPRRPRAPGAAMADTARGAAHDGLPAGRAGAAMSDALRLLIVGGGPPGFAAARAYRERRRRRRGRDRHRRAADALRPAAADQGAAAREGSRGRAGDRGGGVARRAAGRADQRPGRGARRRAAHSRAVGRPPRCATSTACWRPARSRRGCRSRASTIPRVQVVRTPTTSASCWRASGGGPRSR